MILHFLKESLPNFRIDRFKRNTVILVYLQDIFRKKRKSSDKSSIVVPRTGINYPRNYVTNSNYIRIEGTNTKLKI